MQDNRHSVILAATQVRQELQRAEQALRLRQFEAAESICHAILKFDPRQATALQILGLAQAQRADNVAAEQTFRRLLEVNPGVASAHTNLGNLYVLKGDAKEAERSYRAAIALKPTLIEAHFNLGLALKSQGMLFESLAALRKAIDLKPDYVDALTQSGVVLLALENRQAAIDMFKRSLALRENQFEAHYNLGITYLSLDQFENAKVSLARAAGINDQSHEVFLALGKTLRRLQNRAVATSALARAAALKPDCAEAHAELAGVFLEDGWTKAALDEIGKALALQSDRAMFHLTYARILSDLNRLDEAEAENLKAVELAPDSIDALVALGQTHLGIGRTEKAKAVFERALALHPNNVRPLLELARVERFTKDDPRLPGLVSFLATESSLGPVDRADLHFSLGRAYDETGDYDRAFEHFDIGNRLQREGYPDTEPDDIRWFDRTKEAYTKELFVNRGAVGSDSRVPIFVLGMPRSGTTLVEQIISSHPRVRAAGEVQDFQSATQILTTERKYTKEMPALVHDLTNDDFRRLGDIYVERLRMRAPEGDRITDKLLGNYNRLGLIKLALPNATVFHCRRNPVDVCVSIYTNHFAEVQEHTNDLGRLGRFYRRYHSLMQHWRDVLPQDSFVELQYEETVQDLEKAARQIIERCGLDWDPRCLDFQKNERRVSTLSITQVRRPIYTSSINRWRNYEKHLGPLLEGLGDLAPSA